MLHLVPISARRRASLASLVLLALGLSVGGALRAQTAGGGAGGSIFEDSGDAAAEPKRSVPGTGKGLEILEAVYGVGTDWLDVTDDLRPAVKDNRLMMRVCTPMVSRDPKPNVRKSLKLRYAVDGRECSLELPEFSFVVIGDEPPLPRRMTSGFAVVEAYVGAGTTWRDVTERAREMARQPVMQVRIGHLIENPRERDVVRDVQEVVYLRYAIDGKVSAAVVREGEVFKIDTRNPVQPALFVTP